MSFWKRTLAIFRNTGVVKLQLRHGRQLIGELDTIGDTSCSLKKVDGAVVLVEFADILGCEPAVAQR